MKSKTYKLMKRIIFITTFLVFGSLYAFTQDFYLDENGVTIKCDNCQSGDTGTVNGILYEAVDRDLLLQRRDEGADLTVLCTSLVSDMDSLFAGREDFNQDIGSWDVSHVTSMKNMFAGIEGSWVDPTIITAFNQDISSWDVSHVADMSGMFFMDTAFNQDLGTWDVSSVTDMSRMFAGTYDLVHIYPTSFDGDINSWDVANVLNMSNMFYMCKFNKPVGSWNVSNVRDMSMMFAGQTRDGEWEDFVSPFNQDIGSWDVSRVENMYGMFYTSDFNRDIGDWDVGNVTDMSRMFCLATLFNQDIGDWDVSNVTNMDNMFVWACDFNQDLSGWCVENISSLPDSFNDYCTFNTAYYPIWGTCNTLFYFYLDDNGITIKCKYCQPGDTGTVNGILYEAVDRDLLIQRRDEGADLTFVCTSLVTEMDSLFYNMKEFNQDIGSWDVSNVADMGYMFCKADSFNQDLSGWCVENIALEPEYFAVDCPLQPEYYPHWGEECTAVYYFPYENSRKTLNLYPNPTNSMLTVEIDRSCKHSIEITSLNGQLILRGQMEGTSNHLDLSTFQKGIYFITIRSMDFVTTRKIVKL